MLTKTRLPRREWLIAAALLALTLVPSIAGGFRLGELASGAPETDANARFVQMPLPVVLHIVTVIVYSGVGAFQFLPTLRRRNLAWHRIAGRYLLVPAGIIVAATAIQSVHCDRARTGVLDVEALVKLYRGLVAVAPTRGALEGLRAC